MSLELGLLAYMMDRIFGEFRFIRHPVVIMGDYIKWFEQKFYANSIFRGMLLTLSLLLLVFGLTAFVSWVLCHIHNVYIQLLLTSLIASTTIASKMLYDAVKDIIDNPHYIKYLVSRDTENLSSSDINKAAIETYAENLSDGVIAPLFYLVLFGLEGAFLYKAINTLDSMVGYRNERYEKFGKFSARLDDVANYLPARLTALLIALLMGSKKALMKFYHYGKHHSSPNAGHPIAAMALAIGVRLGGDTSYFGKIKEKPYFGEGEKEISVMHIQKALVFSRRLDILLLIFLGALIVWA